MKKILVRGALLLAAMALVAGGVSRAADDDVPSFKKRGAKEKDWVAEVGTAIVHAARFKPSKIEMTEYKFEEPKKGRKDRKDLKITMSWVGLTKKTSTSTIVVKLDTTDDKEWEVLNISYKDTAAGKPDQAKIQDLIEKFNR